MRRPPRRSTETSILIRMSRAEKRALEMAAEKAAEDLPSGARLPTYAFVLSAALDRAREMGITVDEKRGRKENGR